MIKIFHIYKTICKKFFILQEQNNLYFFILNTDNIFLQQYYIFFNNKKLNYCYFFKFIILTFSGISYKITKRNTIIDINTTKKNLTHIILTTVIIKKIGKQKFILISKNINQLYTPIAFLYLIRLNYYTKNGCFLNTLYKKK